MITDEQALQALKTLRAWLSAAASSPRSYDADHLPPGVTRDAFLRRHGARVRAGVEGWSRVGHGRVVTVAAWEADVASETSRRRASRRPIPENDARARPRAPAPTPADPPSRARARAREEDVSPANDVTAELEAALGVRIRRGA